MTAHLDLTPAQVADVRRRLESAVLNLAASDHEPGSREARELSRHIEVLEWALPPVDFTRRETDAAEAAE